VPVQYLLIRVLPNTAWVDYSFWKIKCAHPEHYLIIRWSRCTQLNWGLPPRRKKGRRPCWWTSNSIRCTYLAVQCLPSSHRHHGACLSRIPSLSEWHPFWPGILSPLAWPCPDLATGSESVEGIRKWGVLVTLRHASIQAPDWPSDGMDRKYIWATFTASVATSQWLGIMND